MPPRTARPGPQGAADGHGQDIREHVPAPGPCPGSAGLTLFSGGVTSESSLLPQNIHPRNCDGARLRRSVKEAAAGGAHTLFHGGARSGHRAGRSHNKHCPAQPAARPHPHKSSARGRHMGTTRHTRRRLSAAGPSCWHFYVTSTLFTMPLFARGRGEGGGQQALVLAEESLPQGGRSWAPARGGRHSVRQRVVQRKQRRGRQTGGPCPQMKLEFVPAGAHMPGSRLPPGTLNSEPGCSRSKALQSPGSCHGTSDGREERRA